VYGRTRTPPYRGGLYFVRLPVPSVRTIGPYDLVHLRTFVQLSASSLSTDRNTRLMALMVHSLNGPAH
jgi:hypothetical protein